jgi:hypothetical protein
MNEVKIEARAEVTGVIVGKPELKRHLSGVQVCRFMVAADVGPATMPVHKPIYVWGRKDGELDEEMAELAVRCGRGLAEGDTVTVPGVERHRQHTVKGRPVIEAAIVADTVRLRRRAASGSAGA